ncbi:MAG: hypothetical protein QOG41_1870 [Thermoleophilaceae bacterium]|nr:hypothetical protein [Thermoleophilaceae bacterium]MEA2389097.1 hypothetical protein [Thermoleophilaceae bacterium]
MRPHAALGISLAVATAALALPAGGAPAKEFTPNCHVATALGQRPHELAFRVRCNFEMETVSVDPEDPALVRAVRKHPRLTHPDPEDHFRCWRRHNTARCAGKAGDGVTLAGALRMHGVRCATSTGFYIQGGVDCDPPAEACIAIGYFVEKRDPRPSGCG